MDDHELDGTSGSLLTDSILGSPMSLLVSESVDFLASVGAEELVSVAFGELDGSLTA